VVERKVFETGQVYEEPIGPMQAKNTNAGEPMEMLVVQISDEGEPMEMLVVQISDEGEPLMYKAE
jgi:hypothetical protein